MIARRIIVKLLLAWCLTMAVHAQSPTPTMADLRPFERDSLQKIRDAHANQPFVLAFWSVYCEPCRDELATLQRFKAAHRQVAVILVATDPPEEDAAIRQAMADFDLLGIETWTFADAFVERLRHAVDPRWRGELPRTYFYDRQHRVSALSGRVDTAYLDDWLDRTLHAE